MFKNVVCISCDWCFNSFTSGDDFCCLLVTFANSLDLDQARQKVKPDLDPNCLTLWWYSWKIFLKKVILKKKLTDVKKKKHAKLPSMQRVKGYWFSHSYFPMEYIKLIETKLFFLFFCFEKKKKTKKKNLFPPRISGPSCSKLRMSLVNISLKNY